MADAIDVEYNTDVIIFIVEPCMKCKKCAPLDTQPRQEEETLSNASVVAPHGTYLHAYYSSVFKIHAPIWAFFLSINASYCYKS